MAIHQHLLIDQTTGANRQEFVWGSDDLPGTPAGWNVRLRTCRGGRSEGVQLVEVDNGRMTVAVIPTRGMGIWHVSHENRRLGWQSPVAGPVHPAWVPIFDPSGLGWLEGFDELLCRCGLESNGAPQFSDSGKLEYPLHGRIANLPVSRLEVLIDDTAGSISLVGTIVESRFHFQKLRLTSTLTIPFDTTKLTWHDEVTNIGGTPATMQMLYHTNLGAPVAQAGARLVAPVETMAPSTADSASTIDRWHTCDPGSPGAAELVYFFKLLADEEQNTQVLLKSAGNAEGVSLRWNVSTLPYFTLWKNNVAEADGYVTGLEPATNFPNPRSFEQSKGRVVDLEPAQSWQGEVALEWHTSASKVAACEETILGLQGDHSPETLSEPNPIWSQIG